MKILFKNNLLCLSLISIIIFYLPAQADAEDLVYASSSGITMDEPSWIWVVSFITVKQAKRIHHMKEEELVKLIGLSESHIKGIAPRIPWSVLNPQKDKFDWGVMDRIISLSAKYGKKVAIRISSAASIDSTPGWLWKEIEWWPCRGTKKTALNKLRVPKIWDKNFIAARDKLIRAIGQRYDNNETVQRVVLDDFALDNEMDYIREDRMSSEVWTDFKRNNYFSKEIIENWKGLIDLYSNAFLEKPVFLNLTRIIIPAKKRERQKLDWMIKEIVEYAYMKFKNRLYLQFNGLSDSMPVADRAEENPNLSLLLYYNKNFSTIIGFQTVAPDNMKISRLKKAFDISLTYPVTYVEVIRDFWDKDRKATEDAVRYLNKDF